jgi:hypothetical protein
MLFDEKMELQKQADTAKCFLTFNRLSHSFLWPIQTEMALVKLMVYVMKELCCYQGRIRMTEAIFYNKSLPL